VAEGAEGVVGRDQPLEEGEAEGEAEGAFACFSLTRWLWGAPDLSRRMVAAAVPEVTAILLGTDWGEAEGEAEVQVD